MMPATPRATSGRRAEDVLQPLLAMSGSCPPVKGVAVGEGTAAGRNDKTLRSEWEPPSRSEDMQTTRTRAHSALDSRAVCRRERLSDDVLQRSADRETQRANGDVAHPHHHGATLDPVVHVDRQRRALRPGQGDRLARHRRRIEVAVAGDANHQLLLLALVADMDDLR